MLLNKIPVLDKGFVALIDSCNTTQKLRDIGAEFYFGEYPVELEETGYMTLAIKCPLFFQIYLSKFQLRIIDANNQHKEHEAYIPNSGEIGCPERLDSEAISDDIFRTTNALLINPAAYRSDGADRFIAQVITPINVYTTIIVSGSYSEWCKLLRLPKQGPRPIFEYVYAIEQIITAEWK
jgi:hypothetical protein